MNTTIEELQALYVQLGGELTDTYPTIALGVPVSDYTTIPNMLKALTKKVGSGGSSLPAVTAEDEGSVLSVVNGEWDKANGGGTYNVNVEVTESGGVYSATTDADINDALDAIEAGKIVLGVVSLTEGYITFFRVVSCSEDSIVFGAITYNQTPVYARVVWSSTGVAINIFPLTVAGS